MQECQADGACKWWGSTGGVRWHRRTEKRRDRRSKNKPKPTLRWHYDPVKHPFTFAITEPSAKQQQNMLIHKHLAAKSGRDKI